MYCPNCGREIKEEAKFCMDCGQKLNFDIPRAPQPKETTSPTPNTAKEEKDAQLKKQKNSFLVWIERNPLSAVLSLIGILAVLFFITILVTAIATEHYQIRENYNHYNEGYNDGEGYDYNENHGYNDDYGHYNSYDDSYHYDNTYHDNMQSQNGDKIIESLANTIPQGESVTDA